MFCSPYSQIFASLTVIDNTTFVTIDAIDTIFGQFICFIFVVGKNFPYVISIDANGSDIVVFTTFFIAVIFRKRVGITSTVLPPTNLTSFRTESLEN